MKTARLPLLVLLGGLLLGGCTSFDSYATRNGGLAGVSRFFVVSNLNDNHALDRRIAAAFQARGLTAETGPLTMMPGDTQAVVTFSDHWSWDFGEHLDFLKITVRKPEANDVLASATFSARIPLKEVTPETVTRLVSRLFDGAGKPVTREDLLPPEKAGAESKHRVR
jgi:hypothetical protein